MFAAKQVTAKKLVIKRLRINWNGAPFWNHLKQQVTDWFTFLWDFPLCQIKTGSLKWLMFAKINLIVMSLKMNEKKENEEKYLSASWIIIFTKQK